MGSGVTNFLSTVEARSIGTADIDKMTAAVDKQTAALLGLGKSADKVNQHPGFNDFATKLKEGISNPLEAAGSMVESFLTKIGPLGAATAGAGAAILAVGAAGLSFARDLGRLGDEISDTATRMGLTTKETQEFRFAMKYAGGDMATLEGITRKLSQEIESGGENLQKMGVKFRDVHTGALMPMSGIILEIAQRLAAIPDVAERNAAAIQILGRGGLAVLPDLLELPEAFKAAQQAGLVFGEQTIDSFNKMQKEMAAVDAQWEFLINKLKAGVAIPVLWTISKSGDAHNLFTLPGRVLKGAIFDSAPTASEMESRETGGLGYGASGSLAGHRLDQQSAVRSDAAIKALLEKDATGELEKAKKKLADLEAKLPRGVTEAASAEPRRAVADQQAVVAAIEARIKATKDLTEAEKALAELGKRSAEAYMKAIAGDESNPLNKFQATLGKISVDRADFFRKNPQASLRAEGESYFREQQGAAAITLREDQAKFFAEFDKKGEESGKKFWEYFDKLAEQSGKAGEEYFRGNPEVFGTGTFDRKFLTGGQTPEQALRDARDNERRSVGLYGSQAALGGVPEITQTLTMEVLRRKSADDEYAALKRIADLKNDEQAKQDAIDQQHQKYLDAEIERQQALLQMALRQKQEFQSLFAGGIESLLTGQGGSFLKSAAIGQLDKVLNNVGGAIFSSVSKAIPHSDSKFLQGTLFAADPLKGATDLNTAATIHNTSTIEAFTARMAALSPSGGGGGLVSSAAGTFARLNFGSGTGIGSNSGYNDPLMATAGYGTGEFDAAGNVVTVENPHSPASVSSRFSLGRAAGVGGAALAGGFGIYSGIRQGGARGGLMAAGSGLAAAGGIISLLSKTLGETAGPIGMIAGAVLGSVLPALLGDPKKKRQEEISAFLDSHRYQGPDPVSIAKDMYGRDLSYDQRGNLRPIQVNDNRQYHVSAIDSQDVARFFEKNASAVNRGVARAVDEGGDMVPKLSSAMGLQ